MSEQGFNPNAEQGNNANISAPGWNKLTSFNDEVANGVPRNIQLTPRKQVQEEKGRLNTLAKADGDIERGDWLVITGVAIDSDDNENLFNFDPRPTVKKIESSDSDVTLAVAIDTIYDGKYGRICVTGCCIAKISFPDSDPYKFYDVGKVESKGVLEPTSSDTGTAIFWHDQTAGESMAFVGLNLGGGVSSESDIQVVRLDQVGGTAGSGNSQCSFTYHAYDFLTDEQNLDGQLAGGVFNPNDSFINEAYKRTRVGRYEAANFGILVKTGSNNRWQIAWCNEVMEVSRVPPTPVEPTP